MNGPLEELIVVEVAGAFGGYTGKLLADQGARVLLIEPPSGSEARRRGPFVHDVPGIERSLSFAYFNAMKESVTLNLHTPDGQAIFAKLAESADVVIESMPPGEMDALGLGREALAQHNAQLVYTSITPFGSTGPHSGFEATDITLLAMGGLLSRGGYLDSHPVQAGGRQAVLAADQFAAVGTMLAVLDAAETGVGQWVEVSAQESVLMAHENAIQYFDLTGVVRGRGGERQRQAGIGVYPCADGDIYLLANGLGPFWPELVGWLEEEGVSGVDSLHDDKWQEMEFAESSTGKQVFMEVFGSFTSTRTKAELYGSAKRHRIPLCPVNTPEDLVLSEHLNARSYFVQFVHPMLDEPARVPGLPFKSSLRPVPLPLRHPPLLGESSVQHLRSVGLSDDEVERLAAGGVT